MMTELCVRQVHDPDRVSATRGALPSHPQYVFTGTDTAVPFHNHSSSKAGLSLSQAVTGPVLRHMNPV
jgi:hypothetical protein